MKKILVTGSEGFIGKHLCAALTVLGHSVIRVDKKLGTDLCKLETFRELPEVDLVVHLAAFNGTKYFYLQPFDVIRDNILSTQYLLDFYKGNVEKIIFTGTCESYAGAIDLFSYNVPTDETVPLVISDVSNPRWSYGGSKILNELQIYSVFHQFKQNFTIIRYHNVYGPGQVDHFIPEFSIRAKTGDFTLKGWKNTRSFMYITDAIRATIDIIFNNNCNNQIINVGVNDERTIEEIAKIILEELQINGELILEDAPPGSVSRRQADLSKLEQLTNFVPSVSIEQGIKFTLENL